MQTYIGCYNGCHYDKVITCRLHLQEDIILIKIKYNKIIDSL